MSIKLPTTFFPMRLRLFISSIEQIPLRSEKKIIGPAMAEITPRITSSVGETNPPSRPFRTSSGSFIQMRETTTASIRAMNVSSTDDSLRFRSGVNVILFTPFLYAQAAALRESTLSFRSRKSSSSSISLKHLFK